MKFTITHARHWGRCPEPPVEGASQNQNKEWEINIGSVEELLKVAEQTGYDLIISIDNPNHLPEITIYDDYVE